MVGATGKTYGVRLADLGYRLRVAVTARNARGSATANSRSPPIVAPAVTITNRRPTLAIISVRFAGARVYARFRICDDSRKNVTILATDSRPGQGVLHTRRFTTLVPPRPCGVYTRNWLPAAPLPGHRPVHRDPSRPRHVGPDEPLRLAGRSLARAVSIGRRREIDPAASEHSLPSLVEVAVRGVKQEGWSARFVFRRRQNDGAAALRVRAFADERNAPVRFSKEAEPIVVDQMAGF